MYKKRIGVFGLGKTGISSINALKDNAELVCYDDNENTRNILLNKHNDVRIIHPSNWDNLDYIIVSPGIHNKHYIYTFAKQNNINITCDIDIFFQLYMKNAKSIGVTGTNGKSTTSALISHILYSNNLKYPVGANFGIPIFDLPHNNCHGYVLELSSFQLDLIKVLKLDIAILLNISTDHIDRYYTVDNYIKSKLQIINLLYNKSYAIINIQIYKEIITLRKDINIITISNNSNYDADILITNNKIYDNIFNKKIICLKNKKLQGTHNNENIAAAYAIHKILKLDLNRTIAAICQYSGLPHRMEYITSINNVKFYNDSKATNSDAASKSLSTLNNIYWLVCGLIKQNDTLDAVMPYLSHVKEIYIFGKNKLLFAQLLNKLAPITLCTDMKEAVYLAYSNARNTINACVLLAPSGTSYDEFDNFEDRGKIFIKHVLELNK